MAPCSGITLAGKQCRNNGTYAGRCHHHRGQQQPAGPLGPSCSNRSSIHSSGMEDVQIATNPPPSPRPTAGAVFRARGGRSLMICPQPSIAAAFRGEGGEDRVEPISGPVGEGRGRGRGRGRKVEPISEPVGEEQGQGQGRKVEHSTTAPPPPPPSPPPFWAFEPTKPNSCSGIAYGSPVSTATPAAAVSPPGMPTGQAAASTTRKASVRIIDLVEDLWIEYLECWSTAANGREKNKAVQRALDVQRRLLVRQVVEFAALMEEFTGDRGEGQGEGEGEVQGVE
ncbi:hypothetical protein BC567DRAFT_267592 [Phyllosticta citribraziliensis]